MRILVAEDERTLNGLICKILTAQHYSVDACFNGEEALDYAACAEYDCMIFDIMMPVMSGIEAVKKLRNEGNNTPVIFLTALDSVSDRVKGLDSGADDYLVKPFAAEELLARIRAMLRRRTDSPSNIFTVADLTVDCDKMKVERSGVSISLSSKEFAILEYMIRNAGTVLTRDRIEQHIWNYDYEGGTNVIDVYIRYLRKKIDDNFEPKLIHTVRGTGYVLKDSSEEKK